MADTELQHTRAAEAMNLTVLTLRNLVENKHYLEFYCEIIAFHIYNTFAFTSMNQANFYKLDTRLVCCTANCYVETAWAARR